MNITKAHISVGTLITVVPMLAGAAIWYDTRSYEQHKEIQIYAAQQDVELELQRIELELKLMRVIEERRELTPDEADRKEYLEALREIIIEEQRGYVD
jgi:hypothetical protein